MMTLRIRATLLLAAACLPSLAIAQDEAIKIADSSELTQTAPKKADSKTLTLEKALNIGLAQSPRLAMFQSARGIAGGELQQAGALKNPELSVNSQFIGGNKQYRVVNPRQNFYGLSQVVESGGKVNKRERIASSGVLIADLEYQNAALELIHDITIAYADVIAAQENVALAEERRKLAKEVLSSISERVAAAAAPQIQQNRADMQLSLADIAYDRAKRDLESSRKALAALMGETKLSTSLSAKSFYSLAKPPKPEDTNLPEDTPEMRWHDQQLTQSRQKLSLERANALPDPRIDVGITEISGVNGRALTVGLAVPIPVLNANRGNIEAARHGVKLMEEKMREAGYVHGMELEKASQRMQSAYNQANTLKKRVIPAAQKSFGLAREGYVAGRFLYLDVLDTQRGLFDAKQQYIETLRDYHAAKAGVELLMAKNLGLLAAKGESK
ncbi:TolC family protein [Tautonia sociabilis]|uniref:TolC family protein n=1 Tax=Tautonia sociabilis TaxID=2080755 RepID=A0A432MR98_9BACT|nr:TolC family protein [Tautonia sociabilis]RUL89495.1 TolC family protein [Tautonia sociabilis]